jgi:hypothetical protein
MRYNREHIKKADRASFNMPFSSQQLFLSRCRTIVLLGRIATSFFCFFYDNLVLRGSEK